MPELFLGTLEEVPKKARTSVKNRCYYLVLPRVCSMPRDRKCNGRHYCERECANFMLSASAAFKPGGREGGLRLEKSPPTLNACMVSNHKQNVHNFQSWSCKENLWKQKWRRNESTNLYGSLWFGKNEGILLRRHFRPLHLYVPPITTT